MADEFKDAHARPKGKKIGRRKVIGLCSKWSEDPLAFVHFGGAHKGALGIENITEVSCNQLQDDWHKYFASEKYWEKELTEDQLNEEISQTLPNFPTTVEKEIPRIRKRQGSFPQDYPKLPTSLALCVALYCDYDIYKTINDPLWGGREPSKLPVLSIGLLKAIRHLPYYKGENGNKTVYRGLPDKTDRHGNEYSVEYKKNDFQIGEVITFKGFTSCSKSIETAQRFASNGGGKGLIMEIKVDTGRDIERFSQYYEREVIVSPMTMFQVKSFDDSGVRPVVKLQEVQIAKGDHTVLWIDDNSEQNFGYMNLVEECTDVNFIIASSTKEAIGFMKSPTNKKLLSSDTLKFRIVSDMKRKEKIDVNGEEKEMEIIDAGALFIKEIRDLGYSEEIFVFCQNVRASKKHLVKHGVTDKVLVTCMPFDLLAFASFGKF